MNFSNIKRLEYASGAVSISSDYLRVTINFPAGSSDVFVYEFAQACVLKSITLTNVLDYRIDKNGSMVKGFGSPFEDITIEIGDRVTVRIQRTIAGNLAVVDIYRAYYPTIQLNRTSPQVNIGTHLYKLNYTFNTVHVIELDRLLPANQTGPGTYILNPVVATINLPVGGANWNSVTYRASDKHIYVYSISQNALAKINADPASPDFNKLYSLTGVLDSHTSFVGLGAGYTLLSNYLDGNIACTTNNGCHIIDPEIPSFLGTTPALSSNYNGYFIAAKNCYYVSEMGTNGTYAMTIDTTGKPDYPFGTNSCGNLQYDFEEDLFYQSRNGLLAIMNGDYSMSVSIVNSYSRSGQLCLAGVNNKCFAAGNDTGLAVIDTLTKTNFGTGLLAMQNLAANETRIRSVVYSSRINRVIAEGANYGNLHTAGRLHIINPENPIGGMYENYLAVGTMNGVGAPFGTQLAINELIP
jgi:hypothetical protein